jgi:hypothetical protein
VTVGSFPGSLAGNGLRGPAGPWAIQRLPGLGAAAVGAIASQHRPAMTQDVVDVVAAAAAAAAAVSAAMPCPCPRVGRATVAAVVIESTFGSVAAAAVVSVVAAAAAAVAAAAAAAGAPRPWNVCRGPRAAAVITYRHEEGAAAVAPVVEVGATRRLGVHVVFGVGPRRAPAVLDVSAAGTAVPAPSSGVVVGAATSAAAVIMVEVPCQYVDVERAKVL